MSNYFNHLLILPTASHSNDVTCVASVCEVIQPYSRIEMCLLLGCIAVLRVSVRTIVTDEVAWSVGRSVGLSQ